MYKSWKVKVSVRELVVDLLLLDFQSFNLILGIDWLAAYHTTLDCFQKTIVFHPPNSELTYCKQSYPINKSKIILCSAFSLIIINY